MSEDSKKVAANGRPLPPNAGKGRPKGSTNKLTRTVKEAIEQAFDMAGGARYLEQQAHENPVAFMTLLGKIIPAQVEQRVAMMEPVIFQRIDASGHPSTNADD